MYEKEISKLIANALSKHSSTRVETAAKSKPFIGKVGDTHYFINVDGVDSGYVSQPFGRQLDSIKKINEFKKSAKSTHISIKRVPIAKAFKQFKDLYKPVEFFGSTKINDSFKDDSFQIWYTVSDETASLEIAATKKNIVASKMSKEQLLARIAKDSKMTEEKIAKLANDLTSYINLARNPTVSSYSKLEKKFEELKKYLTPVMGSKSPLHNIINVLDDLDTIKNLKKK